MFHSFWSHPVDSQWKKVITIIIYGLDKIVFFLHFDVADF